ncbi:MAG: YceI family protein, partial [Candidatus Acidiferrales bacterium]
PALATEKYLIDPVHTFVGFAARHLMVSTVRGEFRDFSGEILMDEKDLTKSSVSVAIKVASVDTKVERRDNHLRSPDFLAAEQYPEITFTSKRVEKRGDGYVAVGDLTIRGVTKEVALPFTLSGPIAGPGGRKRIGTESEITINRHDFGVNWNNLLEGGGVIVGPEIRITLNVEAVEAPPEPKPQP